MIEEISQKNDESEDEIEAQGGPSKRSKTHHENEFSYPSKVNNEFQNNLEGLLQEEPEKKTEVLKFEADEDVREEGTLETHSVRKILVLNNGKKEKEVGEPTCFVEWMPGPRDNGFKPKDSIISYEQLKKVAPKVVVDFYERHMILA